MKRRRFKIPFPILFLLVISFIYLSATVLEFRFIIKQKKYSILSEKFTDSFDYSLYSCFSTFIKKITASLFYIGVFYFSNAIKSISNNDYEFCTFFVFSHWIIVDLPFNIIQRFLVDGAFNMNVMPFSSFMEEQIFQQFLVLIFSYFSVFLFISIGQKFSPYTIDTTIISGEDNFDFTSSSSYISNEDKTLPPLEVDKEPENPLMKLFFIFYALILFIIYISINIYDKRYYKKNYFIQPNGKLLGVISYLNKEENIEMNNTLIYLQSKINEHLTLDFSNNIRRTLYLSDNLVNKLSDEQLTSILSTCFYRKNSQEGFFKVLTYFLEFFFYPFIIKFIIKTKIDDDLKLGNFISTVIPLSFVYLFIMNTCFSLLRNAITQRIILNSDSFCVDMGLPIEDALVRVFTLNKDDVMHSFLYSTFILDLPTLQTRLQNIYKTKQSL